MLGLLRGDKADRKKVAASTAEEFARLYEEHMPKVFRYVSYQVSNTVLAEDLTSAAFEKALTKFRSYDEKKASFATWIIAIARNTVIDYFRKNSKEQSMQKENFIEAQQAAPAPDDTMVKAEELQLLRECLDTLSDKEQEIISLKFGGEMTNRQIAKTLGLSESNVAVIIYRTVRKLREQFHGVAG